MFCWVWKYIKCIKCLNAEGHVRLEKFACTTAAFLLSQKVLVGNGICGDEVL